jgi:hypothetical protein
LLSYHDEGVALKWQATLSIADGGEIAFLPLGQPLPGFGLKMKITTKS